jgi:type II secretory pathway component PulF
MLFSKQLPLPSLVELCRSLRHLVGVGMLVRDVFRQLSERGSRPLRPVAERIHAVLSRGDNLETALEAERQSFPPLFLATVVVGERTGNLAEVCTELEKYYQLQQQLQRRLKSQSIGPLLQFGLAVCIIALLIFVLGAIRDARGGPGMSVFGLSGATGSLIFLGIVFGVLGALVGLYLLLTRKLRYTYALDKFSLTLPLIGPCREALALARFSLALRLTMESGLSVVEALRLSLEATGNAAYVAVAPVIRKAVKRGDDLTVAVIESGRFPEEFCNVLAVGEESGRIPEVMGQQAAYYQEEAGRRLKRLQTTAVWTAWLIYAAFMIFAIFNIARTSFSAAGF